MRTLVQPISRWLKQGQQPRTFVRITNSAGTEILFSGTQALGTAINDIDSIGAITRSIRHEGGASVASGMSLQNLILNNRLPLCTEAALTPQHEAYGGSIYPGAARLLSQGSTGQSYADTRNSATGNFAEVGLVVGRSYSAGLNAYGVYRSILQYYVPAMSTIEDAYIELTGAGLYMTGAFYIGVVAGTWADFSNPAGMFNDFTGYGPSGTYPVTLFNESWSTSEYDTICRIRFNAVGRAAVKAAAGGMLRLVLISYNDYTATIAAPTGNEFVQFTTAATLKLRYNSFTLENQIVETYYGVDPLPATYAGMDKTYTGVVDRYEINDRNLDIESRQNDFKKNRLIPSKVITLADWPNCPAVNVGKPYPIVYGAATAATTGAHAPGIGFENYYVFSHHSTGDQVLGLFDYFPGLVVDPGKATADSPMIVLISGHDIYQAYSGVSAEWESGINAYGRWWSYAANIQGSTYRFLNIIPERRNYGTFNGTSFSEDYEYEDYFGSAVSCIPNYILKSLNVTNPEAVYAAGCTIAEAGAYLDVGFPAIGSGGASINKAEICFSLTDTSGGGTLWVRIFDKNVINVATGTDGVTTNLGGGIINFYSGSANFTTLGITTDDILFYTDTSGITAQVSISLVYDSHNLRGYSSVYGSTGQAFHINKPASQLLEVKGIHGVGDVVIDATGFIDWNIDQYYIEIVCDSCPSGSIVVSYLQVRFFSSSENKTEIYFDKKGYKYGSWITGRGFTSGNLIENPASVIESIARDEMGLATAEIDTAAFDTAATALSGLKFAFQLLEQKNSQDILDELAFQARLHLYWDSQDRLKIKLFNAAAKFPNSTTDIPALMDIFTITGAPLGDSFTTHQILSGPNLSKVNISDVKNDFIINYDYNYGMKGYSKTLHVNKDGGNLDSTICTALGTTNAAMIALCAASYAATGNVNTLSVDAWAIRDETTATALAKHLIERLSPSWWILEFQAGNSANVFEEGDFINVRDELIDNRFGTAVMNTKKWMIISLDSDPISHNVGIKVIEV